MSRSRRARRSIERTSTSAFDSPPPRPPAATARRPPDGELACAVGIARQGPPTSNRQQPAVFLTGGPRQAPRRISTRLREIPYRELVWNSGIGVRTECRFGLRRGRAEK